MLSLRNDITGPVKKNPQKAVIILNILKQFFLFFFFLFVMKFCLLVYMHSCPAETPSTEIFASVFDVCAI